MRRKRFQSGVMLLEALIGLLIFAIGILGLIGMQAVATSVAGDAKYRAEAAMHADRLINQMWADNRATMEADYEGSDGSGGGKYLAWLGEVTAAGTGLPGASRAGNLPTVDIDATGRVTVTVRWQGPNEPAAHRYVTVATVR